MKMSCLTQWRGEMGSEVARREKYLRSQGLAQCGGSSLPLNTNFYKLSATAVETPGPPHHWVSQFYSSTFTIIQWHDWLKKNDRFIAGLPPVEYNYILLQSKTCKKAKCTMSVLEKIFSYLLIPRFVGMAVCVWLSVCLCVWVCLAICLCVCVSVCVWLLVCVCLWLPVGVSGCLCVGVWVCGIIIMPTYFH